MEIQEELVPNLNTNFDAQDWARAWMAVKIERPELGSEFGEMVAWFANALVTGYDHGYNAARRVFAPVLEAIIHELGVPQHGYPQPVANAYKIAIGELLRIDPTNVLLAPQTEGSPLYFSDEGEQTVERILSQED